MNYDKRPGGPYDRGTADAYYQRAFDPHYYVGKAVLSDRVELLNMTPDEIVAYTVGYREQEQSREVKDWGRD